MAKNKSLWKKIWEPEDSHLFGELFLIIGAIFLTKFIDQFLPNSGKWIYLSFGFIFLLYGIKLIRNS